MRYFICVISIFLFLHACTREESCLVKDGIVSEGVDIMNFSPCFSLLDTPSVWIQDTTTFYSIISLDTANFTDFSCDASFIDSLMIDFSAFDLVGLRVSGTGCSVGVERSWEQKSGTSVYVYTARVYQCGDCELLRSGMEWLKVPKVPEGFSVEYLIEYPDSVSSTE